MDKFVTRGGKKRGPEKLNNPLERRLAKESKQRSVSEFLRFGCETAIADPRKAESCFRMIVNVLAVERTGVVKPQVVFSTQFDLISKFLIPKDDNFIVGENISPRGFLLLLRYLEKSWQNLDRETMKKCESMMEYRDLQERLETILGDVVADHPAYRENSTARQHLIQYIFKVFSSFHADIGMRKKILKHALELCTKGSEIDTVAAMAFVNYTANANLKRIKMSEQFGDKTFLLEHIVQEIVKSLSKLADADSNDSERNMCDVVDRLAFCIRGIDYPKLKMRVIYELSRELCGSKHQNEKSSSQMSAMLKEISELYSDWKNKNSSDDFRSMIAAVMIGTYTAELLGQLPSNKTTTSSAGSPLRSSKRRKSFSPAGDSKKLNLLNKKRRQTSSVTDIVLNKEQIVAIRETHDA